MFFRCIGSGQHLKSKFGTGYHLEIKVLSSQYMTAAEIKTMDKLDAFVKVLFPDAIVQEAFAERVIYKIPQGNMKSLGKTFKALEEGERSICLP